MKKLFISWWKKFLSLNYESKILVFLLLILIMLFLSIEIHLNKKEKETMPKPPIETDSLKEKRLICQQKGGNWEWTGYQNIYNCKIIKEEEIVYNSPLDGSVYQAKNYLKKHLKDPDSYQSDSWGQVIRASDGSFTVWNRFRSKNSFGGYVIDEIWFHLDKNGNVIETRSIK